MRQTGHRTRFRPTTNGPLHIGGGYVAYQCWRAARSLGGQFVLIEDDIVVRHKKGAQHVDRDKLDAELGAIAEGHLEDLEWLGIAPDEWHWASEFADAHDAAAERLGIPSGRSDVPQLLRYVYSVAGTPGTAAYHPWLTVGRVSDDHELGVTAIVRGADLISEIELYDHIAKSLYGEAYSVRQDYLPLVLMPDGAAKLSKSIRSPEGTIAFVREIGMDPVMLRSMFGRIGCAPPGDAGYGYEPWQTSQVWFGTSAHRYIDMPKDVAAEYLRLRNAVAEREAEEALA